MVALNSTNAKPQYLVVKEAIMVAMVVREASFKEASSIIIITRTLHGISV